MLAEQQMALAAQQQAAAAFKCAAGGYSGPAHCCGLSGRSSPPSGRPCFVWVASRPHLTRELAPALTSPPWANAVGLPRCRQDKARVLEELASKEAQQSEKQAAYAEQAASLKARAAELEGQAKALDSLSAQLAEREERVNAASELLHQDAEVGHPHLAGRLHCAGRLSRPRLPLCAPAKLLCLSHVSVSVVRCCSMSGASWRQRRRSCVLRCRVRRMQCAQTRSSARLHCRPRWGLGAGEEGGGCEWCGGWALALLMP